MSYADDEDDQYLVQEFEKHLSALRQQGLIDIWDKSRIGAGDDWLEETENHLRTADLILLMISPDFIYSDSLNEELEQAIERRKLEEITVVPIILRPVDWEGTPFSKFGCLPQNRKPVKSWINIDEAFYDITNSIKSLIRQKIKDRRYREYELIFNQAIEEEYPLAAETEVLLEKIHQQLKLTPREVSDIENSVRERKRQEYKERRRREYKQVFLKTVEKYPLSLPARLSLEQARQQLKLSEAEAEDIEIPILLKKQQEYQRNLDRYRQEYQQKRYRYFFLKSAQRQELSQLKHALKLQDADVSKVESQYTVVHAAQDYFHRFKIPILLSGTVMALIGGFAFTRLITAPRTNQPTPTPPELAGQSLSEQEAIDLIDRWLQAKPKIFGVSRDLQLAKELTTDPKYREIVKGLGNMSNSDYYIFEKPSINYNSYSGFFCVMGNKAEIHLAVSQEYTVYKNNEKQEEPKDQVYDGVFGLKYDGYVWKLADDGIADDIEKLSDFRERFWEMEPLTVEEKCSQGNTE